MKNEALKSMMNPVRLTIIRAISKNNQMTTKEIQEVCGDISQATLYRHLSDLRKNDIIQVVAENQIRGTVEKVYAIKDNPMTEIQGKGKNLTKEELSDIFSQYIISIMSDFEEYMKKSKNMKSIDKELSLGTTSMFLSDEETLELFHEMNESLMKRINNESTPKRKLRKISIVLTTSLDTNYKGEK